MIYGEGSLIASLTVKEKDIINDAKKGMTMAAGEIRSRSVELTPRDTGDLRKHSFRSKAEFDGKHVVSNVGYEAPIEKWEEEGYAVYVHEMEEIHHDVGQAKFLEEAVKRSGDVLLKSLHSEMKF